MINFLLNAVLFTLIFPLVTTPYTLENFFCRMFNRQTSFCDWRLDQEKLVYVYVSNAITVPYLHDPTWSPRGA